MQLKEIQVLSNSIINKYSAESYLLTGIYLDEVSNILYFVNKENNTVFPVVDAKKYMLPVASIVGVCANSSTNINDILKIIAVCNKPEIIKDLV